MNHLEIIILIYKCFVDKLYGNDVSIDLHPPSLVGTVQDDPFDNWITQKLEKALPFLEVVQAGKLTSPDIVIRDPNSGEMLGLEVKKLIQKANGADPRGLTLDYNSSVPCGQALVKIGEDTVYSKG